MPHVLIREGIYFSQSDEAAFFRWLESIPGVVRVVGTPEGLVVSLRSKRLSQVALRELLSLHFSYGLSMRELVQFETPQNQSWFRAPHMYWHEEVFGK
jgi:hypothetical protein